MLNQSTPFAVATLLAVAASGCQQAEPQAAKPAVAAAVAKAEPIAEQEDDSEQLIRERVVQAMKDYVAPFPERNNVFVAPSKAPVVKSKRTTEGTVQLRGVVNVGKPRAILDIEGAIALVPVGEEEYGVRVVAIEDKTVTLRRGSNKWTASLD